MFAALLFAAPRPLMTLLSHVGSFVILAVRYKIERQSSNNFDIDSYLPSPYTFYYKPLQYTTISAYCEYLF